MTKHFDYIIIGAGSAGCILANKLSENLKNNVLLLEAGGSDQRFWIKTPLGYAFTYNDPKVNWRYNTEPDKNLYERTAYWPRGKVIGGSSSINAMAYFRGLENDFTDWENAGAKNWGWDNVLKTYQVIEKHVSKKEIVGDGPIQISDLSEHMHPFTKNFMAAAKELNWPTPKNTPIATEGLGYVHNTTKNGKRFSSADAFLHPIKNRKNLHIIKNATVEKIIIENLQAKGVIYKVNNIKKYADANKEIILSAGAIGSPQILQLSGVGPKEILKKSEVKLIHHSPEVGQGLQDHLAITKYFSTHERTLNAEIGNIFGKIIAGFKYIINKSGPLSIPVNQTSGFVRSEIKSIFPDIQIYANPIAYSTDNSGKTYVDKKSGFLISAQPTRPTSRGSINIQSPDINIPPLINANSLDTKDDQLMAIKAGKIIQQISNTNVIKSVTTKAFDTNFINFNDNDLLNNFCEYASTVYHPCCTCRMGNSINNSVINHRLQIHGLKNIRVVDASSFPNITSGNINAPTMMLAYRASEMILEDNI